jgi:hypothetical protein
MCERKFKIWLVLCLLFIAAFVITACNSDLPLDGKSVLEDRCVECHNLSRVKSSSMAREEWSRTLDRMITLGAELPLEERDVLLDYLEATYP